MLNWRTYKIALAAVLLLLSLSPLASVGHGLAQGPGEPERQSGEGGLPTIPTPRPVSGRDADVIPPGTDAEAYRYRNAGPVNIIIQLNETPAVAIMGAGDGGAPRPCTAA